MQGKRSFFILVCFCHLCFYLGFLGFGVLNLSIVLSFEFSFLSAFLVILSSYLNYKKNISIRARHYHFEKRPLMIFVKKIEKNQQILNLREINDDLRPSFSDKIRNFALFFSLVKFLAYGILIAGFWFLKNQNQLSILGYLSGISALMLCVLFFILRVRHES